VWLAERFADSLRRAFDEADFVGHIKRTSSPANSCRPPNANGGYSMRTPLGINHNGNLPSRAESLSDGRPGEPLLSQSGPRSTNNKTTRC
jgi:hypothetical protein